MFSFTSVICRVLVTLLSGRADYGRLKDLFHGILQIIGTGTTWLDLQKYSLQALNSEFRSLLIIFLQYEHQPVT